MSIRLFHATFEGGAVLATDKKLNHDRSYRIGTRTQNNECGRDKKKLLLGSINFYYILFIQGYLCMLIILCRAFSNKYE